MAHEDMAARVVENIPGTITVIVGPEVGLEPTTRCLQGSSSTLELLRLDVVPVVVVSSFIRSVREWVPSVARARFPLSAASDLLANQPRTSNPKAVLLEVEHCGPDKHHSLFHP